MPEAKDTTFTDPSALKRLSARAISFISLLLLAGALFVIGAGIWPFIAIVAGLSGCVAILFLQTEAGRGTLYRSQLAALEAANRDHSDLRHLVESEKADQDDLSNQINQLITRMGKVLSLLLKQNVKIALASADARKLGVKSQKNAKRQAELAGLIFQSSEENSKALKELSARANGIADANTLNLDIAKTSLVELGQVLEHVESSSAVLNDFGQTVGRLVHSSKSIRNILDTVQGFAAQTNMLALNAAIEAARAGEHGRGFAVVADEVRDLAGKVGNAADQISELVAEMGNAVSQTDKSTQSATASTDDAKHAITATLGEFERMVAKFEHTHEDLLLVGSTVEELSQTNQEGLQRADEIRQLGEEILKSMGESFQHADVMRDTSNFALQQLARFRLHDGLVEPLVKTLLERRDLIEKKMEELQNRGVDLFDRNYKPIPGSKMGRFNVSWAEALQKKLQADVDQWHENAKAEGIIYWLPSDDRRYSPVNRKAHSNPETGDLKVDAAGSRYMFFSVDNDIELQNLANCKDVGMGTFVVPTGHTVITLFAPIYLKGRRWGQFSVGVLPHALKL